MIKIEAIVREEKAGAVAQALDDIGINGYTMYNVIGFGVQRGRENMVKGMKLDTESNPKIKFEIVVSSESWEKLTIDAVRKAAYTGDYGDGNIFSYDIKAAMKIRTGETGYEALQLQE